MADASAANSGGVMREITLDDAAMQLAFANRVVFVPATACTAQAQHAVRTRRTARRAGRHSQIRHSPGSGRMPGHMNVLLAEANVPYASFTRWSRLTRSSLDDVAVVIGANDVVNPDARDNPNSLIAGMPILEVDRAKSVIVLKRGQGRGFSGLENHCFSSHAQRCSMGMQVYAEPLAQAVQHV